MGVLLLSAGGTKAFATNDSEGETVEFRFSAKSDHFMAGYSENEVQIQKLFECITSNKQGITNGDIPVYVDGYCNSRDSEKLCLSTAKRRSNRVKSEMITRCGLTEQCFHTTNHATNGDYVIVRITLPKSEPVILPMPQPSQPVEIGEPESEPKSEPVTLPADTTNQRPVVIAQTTHRPHFDLRANLLRWATLTPDLGIEWHASKSFSVLVNGSWTTWSWNNKDRRYALWEVLPELRLYVGAKRSGYLGVYGLFGSYNYKFTATGRQGDIRGGGLKGGYILRLNRAFSIDFSLGVGGVNADIDKYRLYDGVRVRHGHENKNHWGINHAGITLVWNIF